MISSRAYVWALVLLVIIRIFMAIGVMHDFPHIQDRQDKGWYVYMTYETEFFKLAKSLAEFHPIATYPALGFSLFLVPFIWLFKAKAIEDILLPVTLFHSVFLFGISIILVALIAEILSNGNKKAALIAASLWVILPYLMYLTVCLNPHLACSDIPQKRTFYLMWITLLDDPLYTFLIILGVYTFILYLLKHRKKIFYPIFMGMLFGYGSLINPLAVMPIGLSFILAFMFMKHIKAFIYSAVGFAIFIIPQLVYNWYFNSSPFKLLTIGEERKIFYNGQLITKNLALNNIIFSISRIKDKFNTDILFALAILFSLVLFSLISILRRKDKSVILIIWILPYLSIIFFYSGFFYSILEWLLPILPGITIMFSLAIVSISEYLLNLRNKTA